MAPDFDLATVDRLLTTTRAVRRRLDLARPVPPEVVQECIRLSMQAPTGSNRQTWRWVVVTDAGTRRRLGEIYAKGAPAIQAEAGAIREDDRQTRRVYDSAAWLAEHLAEVPVHVIPCVEGRPPEQFNPVLCSTLYGSILPAVWSFQLALRSRGLGSVLTTMHLLFEREVQELLEIPKDVLQVALLPVAYTRGGDFRPAARPPLENITFWNRWGEGSSSPGGAWAANHG
jgi:nitroreductase